MSAMTWSIAIALMLPVAAVVGGGLWLVGERVAAFALPRLLPQWRRSALWIARDWKDWRLLVRALTRRSEKIYR